MTNITIHAECRLCNEKFDIPVRYKDYSEWQSGNGYIQDLMPYLDAGQRELLISATCNNCWIELFGSEDDYEEEDFN